VVKEDEMNAKIAALFLPFLLLLSLPVGAQTAFQPGGNTVTLSVTGASARVQVQPAGTGSPNIRVYNSGTVAVFLACGDVAVTAAVASAMPVAPGSVEIIHCGQTYVAGISAGTAATVYLTPGSGI
jgi:hypothetical protein